MTVERVRKEINELLDNPKYTTRAKELQKTFKATAPSLDQVAMLIERAFDPKRPRIPLIKSDPVVQEILQGKRVAPDEE